MNVSFSLRYLVLTLVVICGIVACSREDNADAQILQANAYLDVAELYRNQGQFRAGIIEAQNALQAAPAYERTQLFMSRLYMDIGNSASAQLLQESLLDRNPNDVESILLLAESHLNQGDRNQVLTLLEDLEPATAEQQTQKYWLLGNAYAGNNNLLAAREALSQALEFDSTHTPSLITLSMLEYQAGNEFGAQEFMDTAIEVEPENLDLWIWRGQFALLREEYPESEAAFFQALQIMGNYDTMIPKRLAVLQAIITPLRMQQKNDEALRYSAIIAESPQGQFQDSYNSAVAMFQQGEYEQAEQQLDELLSRTTGSTNSNILMGLTRYAQGNFQGALESLDGLVNAETASPDVIKVLAATHLRQNQPERALSVLQEASGIYPQDGSLLAMIGVSQQSMGEIELSIESFNRALELETNSPDLHFALAGSLFRNQQVDAALEQLMLALAVDPNYNQAKTTLIDILLTEENFAEATRLVDDWLATDADSVTDNNLAGRINLVQENYPAAKRYFANSLSLEPNNVLALLFLARINMEEGDYDLAEDNFKAALQVEPANIEALSGLLSLGNLNDTIDERITDVIDIIDRESAEFIPPLVLSQYYLVNNDIDNAQIHGESAYERNVNEFTENTLLEILFRKIGLAREQEDLDSARELANYAQQISVDNLQVLIIAAGVESQAGEYGEVEKYIGRIKELQPTGSALGSEIEGDLFAQQRAFDAALGAYQQAWEISANAGLGLKLHNALQALGRADDAVNFLDDWEAVSPNDPALNLFRGMNYQENNRNEEAIERYELIISQEPDDIIVLNNLAWLYQDSNPERALELAARAATLYPENADVLDTYGWILLKQDNREEALPILERASELAPDSAAIAEHLAAARQ